MMEKLTFTNSMGDKLVGILENPTGKTTSPVVIICHGHSSNKDRSHYINIAKSLNQKGIASFRFDFYGHGESEGEFANATPSEVMDDVLQAIRFMRDKGFPKIGLVGSSFGGLACILTAAEEPDIFALALKSPVSNYADLFNTDRFKVKRKEWQKRGWLPYDEDPEHLRLNYIFYTDAVARDGYAVAPKITAPTLIVHGDLDKDVPITQSQKLVTLIPHCQLKVIHGSDHKYTQETHAQEMVKAITDFIVQYA
jgi:alpha/beta superfamily hydrolase